MQDSIEFVYREERKREKKFKKNKSFVGADLVSAFFIIVG